MPVAPQELEPLLTQAVQLMAAVCGREAAEAFERVLEGAAPAVRCGDIERAVAAAFARVVADRGVTPGIWADMLLTHPEALARLSRKILLFDWRYDTYYGMNGVKVWGKGHFPSDGIPQDLLDVYGRFMFPWSDEPFREPDPFYTADYLADANCPAISLSFPKQQEHFESPVLFPFFFLAGLAVSLNFVVHHDQVGRVYGYDLLGAGTGAVLALLLMFPCGLWVVRNYVVMGSLTSPEISNLFVGSIAYNLPNPQLYTSGMESLTLIGVPLFILTLRLQALRRTDSH